MNKLKYLLFVLILVFFTVPSQLVTAALKSNYYYFTLPDSSSAKTDTVKTVATDTAKGKPVVSAVQKSDSVLTSPRSFKAEELIRGERLFFGLAYPDGQAVNCASCHNTRELDTLNWNPDALEISKKYFSKTALDLSKVLLRPIGDKLSASHKNFILSPEDIVLIKAYMDRFTKIGLVAEKPVITNLILFIIAACLMLFAIIDLLIFRYFKKAWIDYLILGITSVFITYILVTDALNIGRSKDYSPLQPIKFSHAVHAGQNGTPCLYCHSSAPYSKVAGIPPVNVCMNCHLVVRKGKRSGTYEISKIISAWDNQKPIAWIKVHNLPDHVFFSHAQHVTAGKVDCAECHGDVAKMDVIKQVSDLSMGWCINCHRTKKLDVKDNAFYTQYRKLAEKLKNKDIDSATVIMTGGQECMKCHY